MGAAAGEPESKPAFPPDPHRVRGGAHLISTKCEDDERTSLEH